MTNVLLSKLRDKAGSLTNGHRGDVALMGEVVADMAVVLADLSEHGCAVQCRPRFGWPAAVTVTGIVIAIVGLILKFAGG